jgi:hypothetical protein
MPIMTTCGNLVSIACFYLAASFHLQFLPRIVSQRPARDVFDRRNVPFLNRTERASPRQILC